ncbi:hypothetical protein [Helicobacter salomonis]|uniref:hypothetical protein n=1 Tax=Helicobacter salomonis TaxID=56878 RepID=UPI000CF1C40C|nr:hypothetical protein [Helicobacter salomonis]
MELQSTEDKKTLLEFEGKITELMNALEALKTAPTSIADKPADDPAIKKLQKQNGALQEQSGAKDKAIADLQEQIARLLNTTQEQALQTLLVEVYAKAKQISPPRPRQSRLSKRTRRSACCRCGTPKRVVKARISNHTPRIRP